MILSHHSALAYWQQLRTSDFSVLNSAEAFGRPPISSQCKQTLLHWDDDVPHDREIQKRLVGAIPDLEAPFDLLVHQPSARLAGKLKTPHLWKHPLTAGSCMEATPSVLVSSPEFCFLQMAQHLDLIDLILLGYELCGCYASCGETLVPCLPLTSKSLLLDFVLRNAGVRGTERALKAVGHIADDSASHRETHTTLLLCLPIRHGGYGLKLPLMNHRVELDVPTESSDSSICFCDLYWPDGRVGVEYNSDTFHANAAQIAKDSRKRNALEHVGVSVVSVTNQQIMNANQFDNVARQVAKQLGVRIRVDDRNGTWVQRRTLLRRRLLGGKSDA